MAFFLVDPQPGGKRGGCGDDDAGDQSGCPSSLSASPSPAALSPTKIARREWLCRSDCDSGDNGGSPSKQVRQVLPNSGTALK